MKKAIIPFILLLISCRLMSPAEPTRIPASPASTPRPVKELPTPSSQTHLSMKEAWLMGKPEVLAWAADAQIGVEWECEGRLTEDGYCNNWRGLIGSEMRQEAAELRVRHGEVEFDPLNTHKNIIRDTLSAPFTPDEFLDSPAIVQRAMAWMAAQGLAEEKTSIDGMSVKAHHSSLEACGLSSGTAVYVVWTDRPSGRLCLDPYSGSVIFDDLR